MVESLNKVCDIFMQVHYSTITTLVYWNQSKNM